MRQLSRERPKLRGRGRGGNEGPCEGRCRRARKCGEVPPFPEGPAPLGTGLLRHCSVTTSEGSGFSSEVTFFLLVLFL